MKTTVDIHDFRRAFEARRPNQFSRAALDVIFEDIEDYERDTGEETELDVIAICCEWSELTPQEANDQFDLQLDLDQVTSEEIADALERHVYRAISTDSGTIVYHE